MVVEKTQDLFTLHQSLTQEGLILLVLHINTDSKHTQNYASIHKYVWGEGRNKNKSKSIQERESDEIERKTERVCESETETQRETDRERERQTEREREIHC